MSLRPATARGVALVVVLVGGAAFVLLAWWRVPWHPVPGGAVAPVPETSVFTPAELARSDAFLHVSRILSWSSLGVSLVVASLLGLTARGRRVAAGPAGRLGGWWWVRVVVTTGLVLLVGWLATLPFRLGLRSRYLRYGLTEQGLGGWVRDQATSFAVSWLATAVVVVLLLGLARRWPRTWPAVAGTTLAGFVMLASFAYPVLVEPLFNHFTPLPAGALRTQILDLARQEGVHVDDVLVADASRRTTTLNAYVSGYGNTRRVVLYDTAVDALPRPELLSVVAHELGHAHHDDVLTGSLLGGAGSLFAVGLLGLLLPDPTRGRPRDRTATAAAVPLVLALSAWAMLLASPVENSISRLIETRADVAALETTRDPDAFVALQRQLALRSLSDPTPPAWSQLWFGSHPTAMQRVAVARHLG